MPSTDGHAVSHQTIARVAAKVDGAARLGGCLAQDEAVEWSLRQAAVGSWGVRRGSVEERLRTAAEACRLSHTRPTSPITFPLPLPSSLLLRKD